jgi:hypothetical protein
MSLSVHDAATDGWRQTWADSTGNYWHFVGSTMGDAVVFATPDVVDADRVYKRMVFDRIAGGGFHWRGEFSPDGATWTERWAIDYRRA